MAVEPWLSCCRRVHHHQCHVAGGGRCVSPTAWPQRMARLQSFISELLDPRPIWSIHWVWGLPWRRLQTGPGLRSTDKSMCLRSAMCAGTSLKRGNVSKNRDATGRQHFAQWREIYVPACRHYWRSQTSEFPVSDADISCGRPLTLSCLLQADWNLETVSDVRLQALGLWHLAKWTLI